MMKDKTRKFVAIAIVSVMAIGALSGILVSFY